MWLLVQNAIVLTASWLRLPVSASACLLPTNILHAQPPGVIIHTTSDALSSR